MNQSDNKRVRERLNKYIENAMNPNGSKLANRIGISRVTMVQFKNGKTDVSPITLQKIERYLESVDSKVR